MSDLLAYLVLGFEHIADVTAADHLLFLLVLGAVYRLQDWRAALLTVSAFTVGHSITLGVAVAGWVTPSAAWIEFLIPVTIVATGVENLWRGERVARGRWPLVRPALALVFGLVHGMGFAGYLRALLGEEIGVPLLGFNIGVELGQVMILGTAALLFAGVDALVDRARTATTAGFAWRLRSVSLVVTVVALVWAGERWP
ncbi:MAG: HupE/UreJ family protein [Gemmatimonadaceae bacterium]